jgi:hypothetical protein
MAQNYILQVTAGPSYDESTHKVVPVNSATPLSVTSPYMSIDLNVRVQVRVTVLTRTLPRPLCTNSVRC